MITQMRAVTPFDLAPMHNKWVLLADDSPIIRMVVKSNLERAGFLVDVAVSGQEAVEAAIHSSYAIILMDCQMPEMDGYQAALEIRNFEGESRHTPIIALTEGDTANERQKWFEAGMDDYLVKPATLPAILDALDQWGVNL
jgi:CheY-like chemotaxis protein